MTRIEIGRDHRSHRSPQPVEGRNIVDAHAGVQLETELADPFGFRQVRHFTPKRNDPFPPLPLQELQEILRPRRHHPVGIAAAFGRSRAPAHANHSLDLQHSSEAKCFARNLGSLPRYVRLGMKRIAAAIEGDEPKLTAEALAERIGEPLSTDEDV